MVFNIKLTATLLINKLLKLVILIFMIIGICYGVSITIKREIPKYDQKESEIKKIKKKYIARWNKFENSQQSPVGLAHGFSSSILSLVLCISVLHISVSVCAGTHRSHKWSLC